jgi:hypothetical protein
MEMLIAKYFEEEKINVTSEMEKTKHTRTK